MAGVSSTSRPVPTTDSAAAPTMASGWSTAPTVRTMSSRAPAWDRVAATITRSGRSPMDSSTDAGDLSDGLRGHGVLGQRAGERHDDQRSGWWKRMSSDRR